MCITQRGGIPCTGRRAAIKKVTTRINGSVATHHMDMDHIHNGYYTLAIHSPSREIPGKNMECGGADAALALASRATGRHGHALW